MKVNGKTFIVFYLVIGTLSHAKIILDLLLQNEKAKAFSEGGDHPLNPPPQIYPTCTPRGTRVEKIKKNRSYDFNITKVGNKFYVIDHITANVINIYYSSANT